MIADKIKNARTILYYITNLVFLTTNSSKYASEEKPVPAGIIISTLMYALAAYCNGIMCFNVCNDAV